MKLWISKKKWPQNPEKNDILKNLYAFFEGRERVVDAFENKIFPIIIESTGFSDKVSNYSNLRILIPKRMLQKLPIALAQVKTGNMQMKSDKSYNLYSKQKKSLKSI